MADFLRDLRFSIRLMLKRPAVSGIVVLTMALGIGATAAIFSVVNAVLLRPLPFPDSNRLTVIRGNNPQKGFSDMPLSPGTFGDLRNSTSVFEAVSLHYSETANLTNTPDPETLKTALVGGDFFSVMGVRPLVGRALNSDDDRFGAAPVAVLSGRLWTRRFGSDPSVVGKTIELGKKPFLVVGVMPESFRYPGTADVWTPLAFAPQGMANRFARFVHVVGRLKPNASLVQSQSELDALSARLQKDFPKTEAGWTLAAASLTEITVGEARTPLLVLFGAVACVFLIASVNVVNLLLVQAESRSREIAVRTALGAGKARLVRQFFIESLFPALLGTAFGLALARLGVVWLKSAGTGIVPRIQEIGLDANVVAFTAALSFSTCVLFGIVPGLRASQVGLNEVLKDRAGDGSDGRRGPKLRHLLVVGETALAMVLLFGAVLLIQSLFRLQGVDPGFRTEGVLTLKTALPWARYAESVGFYTRAVERLAAIPGVKAVGGVNFFPLDNASTPLAFAVEGRQTDPNAQPMTTYYSAMPDFFPTLGIPVLGGRGIAETDTEKSVQVAVVNESFARKFFPNETPVGKRLLNIAETPVEIVGVVGNVRHEELKTPPVPELYRPFRQMPWPEMTLALKTSVKPETLVGAVRAELIALDPTQPILDIKTAEERIVGSVSDRRFTMTLLTGFAAVALVLAVIGVYGVVSHLVERRTKEIGIRMALGARRSSILALVMAHGGRLVAAGLMLGAVGAFWVSRFLSSLLYEISPTDGRTLFAVAASLAFVSLAACLIPARRAIQTDPLTALRTE